MLGGPTSPLYWHCSGDSPDAQAIAAWSAYTGQDENAAANWGWLNALHPADRASVREAWHRVGYRPHVFSLAYRVFHKGSGYQAYKTLHVPIYDDQHQLVIWLVFFVATMEATQVADEHWEQKIITSLLYTQTELLARIQEAHSESLAQLEAIFESIADGIVVCDNHKHIIKANTAAAQMFQPLLEQYPDCFRSSFEDVMALLQAFDEQGQRILPEQWPLVRLLNGEDLRGDNVVEMRLIFPNGQDVYLSYSGSPLRDQDGNILGAVLAIRDVTERRRMERRIQNSFKMLLSLAEEIVDIPTYHGARPTEEQFARGHVPPALPFQTVGESLADLTCQMLGYHGVDILLRNPDTGRFQLVAIATRTEENRLAYYDTFADFVLSDYIGESAMALLWANKPVAREIYLTAPKPLLFNALLAPMIMDGVLVGVFSVKKYELHATFTEDEVSIVRAIAKLTLLVIERERLQQEWIEAHSSELALREANRRFDTFLSIASHELRTPLAGIKGNIQLAQRRLSFLKSPELPEKALLLDRLGKVQDYLLHAEHRVNVQNRMISDLLDVSRIQANKLNLVMRPCNLAEIVREAVEDQRYTVTERVITLALPTCEEAMVIGDADRLGQVVGNYLTNALKYSPVEQPVEVNVETQEGVVRVSVRDHGPGLSPEEQKRIWERFYRVKDLPTQGDAPPGLGLGLHICRSILEAHHGRFGLESTLGQGCTFWFALPLACADTSKASSTSETRAGSTHA